MIATRRFLGSSVTNLRYVNAVGDRGVMDPRSTFGSLPGAAAAGGLEALFVELAHEAKIAMKPTRRTRAKRVFMM
jgi:hypothetical protein